MLRRSLFCLISTLLLGVPEPSPAAAAAPQIVPTPRAKDMPISATNRPFLAAARAAEPVQLEAQGYLEQEFMVSGYANVYEWTAAPGLVGPASMTAVVARDQPVPYATRMLVRRPGDPAKFSGLVVIELLDPSRLHDAAPLWGLSREHFLRRGDVWIGVTIKPVAARTLQKFDPVRYAALEFNYRQQASCHPATPVAGAPAAADPQANSQDTENGLAWDLIGQVGALLRSSSKENPLLDLNARRFVLAGFGEAGEYVLTYSSAMHRIHRLGDERAVFDGYMDVAGVSGAPLNQCAAPLADGDARISILPRDVPFVAVLTETEFQRGRAFVAANLDGAEGLTRVYEIPGAARSGPYPAGLPDAKGLSIAGRQPEPAGSCVEPASNFPLGLALNAIWQQYDEWLVGGAPMPVVSGIENTADGRVAANVFGNALGGWRLPQLDVPLARYAGSSTPRDGSAQARYQCSITGAAQALSAAELKGIYGSRAAFLKQLGEAVDTAVSERRMLAEDGKSVKAAAAARTRAF